MITLPLLLIEVAKLLVAVGAFVGGIYIFKILKKSN